MLKPQNIKLILKIIEIILIISFIICEWKNEYENKIDPKIWFPDWTMEKQNKNTYNGKLFNV